MSVRSLRADQSYRPLPTLAGISNGADLPDGDDDAKTRGEFYEQANPCAHGHLHLLSKFQTESRHHVFPPITLVSNSLPAVMIGDKPPPTTTAKKTRARKPKAADKQLGSAASNAMRQSPHVAAAFLPAAPVTATASGEEVVTSMAATPALPIPHRPLVPCH
ncbi:hypothetical protein V494_08224 [Pseudogymnoascus sp. VKM F-4513 (FW-928)]|nr:hypothetical protein V494_08224 [Pseudogymnoascus sp. VKM F-4513 (FW-928)]